MHLLDKRLAAVAVGFVVAMALFVPTLTQGGDMDLRTVFSVSHQFTVPGKVLEPNTDYVMMVGDAQTGTRRVVRIYNEDESDLLAMFLAVNDERREPADKTTFTFIEVDEGYPQVVQSWFYPGRNSGLEFIYPKDQALEIAQHAKETVLASDVNLAALDEERGIDVTANLAELEGIDIEAVEPGDVTRETTTSATVIKEESIVPETTVVIENEPEAVIAENRPAEPVVSDDALLLEEDGDNDLIAQNEQPSIFKSDTEVLVEKPSQAQSEDDALDDEELPATAGSLPLLGLLGALSMGLGLGVRLFTSR